MTMLLKVSRKIYKTNMLHVSITPVSRSNNDNMISGHLN